MVYYTGDIHGNILPIQLFIRRHNLTTDDTIVILGDVGLNFNESALIERRKKYKLNYMGVNILCVHGNHEVRPETIPTYKEELWNHGVVYVEEKYPFIKFAKDGEIYDLDGEKSIVIGGAYSVDKFYRLERGLPWFSDEQPSDETKERVTQILMGCHWKIDQVLSHTCPLKYEPVEAFLPGLSQDSIDKSTETWLDKLEDLLDYKRWLCGHWHIDKKIDKMVFMYKSFEGGLRCEENTTL